MTTDSAIPATGTIWAHPLPADRQPRRVELELPDGYRTVVYVHPPPAGVPRRLPVLQMHGIQSHPGWFGLSASTLAQAGHPVYQVTRRGNGENPRGRGDAVSAEQLLDDVEAACRFILADAEAQRLHLLGISWGGKLLACYSLKSERAAAVASLTLVAPGIVPQVDVSLCKKLAIACTLVCDRGRLFDIPLNEPELFTDNPAMQEYLRADPLRLHRATARFLYTSKRLDLQFRRASVNSLSMPVTLLLAQRDRIIDNDRTRPVVSRVASTYLKSVELPAAHTMEFEQDPAEYLRVLREAAAE